MLATHEGVMFNAWAVQSALGASADLWTQLSGLTGLRGVLYLVLAIAILAGLVSFIKSVI